MDGIYGARQANEMISSPNKVVVPLTKDLIVANCTEHGMGTSLMWTVSTRLDQT